MCHVLLSFIFFQELIYLGIAPLLLSMKQRSRPRLALLNGQLAAAVKSSLVSEVSKPRQTSKLVLDSLPVDKWEKFRSSTTIIWLGKFYILRAIKLYWLLISFEQHMILRQRYSRQIPLGVALAYFHALLSNHKLPAPAEKRYN